MESESLEELLSRYRSVDAPVLCGWGVALCELLSYLHTLPVPVVFRDLKPANILLRQADKRLVVVDFGIARPFVAGQVGTVVGTPGYAPPEQYQGLATPQSDIYALGATLHRLLTGYDPEAHAESAGGFGIPPAQSLNPSISPALAAVVARALELVPAARYATAGEMGDALREAGQRPADGSYPSRARPRANRAWFGLAAVCLLVPLVVVGVLRLGPAPSGGVPVAATAGAIFVATNAIPPTALPFASPTPITTAPAVPTLIATPSAPVGPIALKAAWLGACRAVTMPLGGGVSRLAVTKIGDIWFATGKDDVIGHLDPGGRPVLCKLPALGSARTSAMAFQPSSVTVGPTNTVWFTNYSDDSIGIATADGQLQRIVLPTSGYPSDAVTDRAGNVWFIQQAIGVGASRILRLTPLGQLTMYAISGNGVPMRLAADSDGSIWFLQSVSALIWHLDPSGSITSFPVGTGEVYDFAADPRGGIWYIGDGSSIGHLRTNGTDVRYPIPEALWGHGTGGICVDSGGTVWFTINLGRR